MSNILLDVKNISISFKQYNKGLKQRTIKVISDLSLNVHEGEIVAILGSSGSGKSLLAHSILGILPKNAIQEGNMYFENQKMTEKLKEDLRGEDIALVPQSVNFLDPLMKISDQVIGDVPEDKKEEYKVKQREIFEKYNLGVEVDDMLPHQLSGGMARRVLVSTALMPSPKLVIADEPTPGLDEKSVKETLSYFENMTKENVGVLLITHDIDAALKIANRIAIFYAGYVIEDTPISSFIDGNKLLHPYTKALYSALPENGFHLTKGHQPLTDEIKKGCPYYQRCPHKLEKCSNETPELKDLGDNIKVRCFLTLEELEQNSENSTSLNINEDNIEESL